MGQTKNKYKNLTILIIALNVNGPNSPNKKQRFSDQIKKQNAKYKETHLKYKDKYRLKVKGWKKINHVNISQKKAEMAILI